MSVPIEQYPKLKLYLTKCACKNHEVLVFSLELASPSDSLSVTQIKMEEYQGNGAKLDWLINYQDRYVEG
jgi:Putative restriction endonuclease